MSTPKFTPPVANTLSTKKFPTLAERNDKNVNVNKNVHVNNNEVVDNDIDVNVIENVVVKVDGDSGKLSYSKKVKFDDSHCRQTVYINKDYWAKINEIASNEKGIKTKVINDALEAWLKRF